MQVCGLKSLVNYFNVKTHDIWEGNMATREILTEHIHSLRFWDIRGVTLWRVILPRLRGLSSNILLKSKVDTLELYY